MLGAQPELFGFPQADRSVEIDATVGPWWTPARRNWSGCRDLNPGPLTPSPNPTYVG